MYRYRICVSDAVAVSLPLCAAILGKGGPPSPKGQGMKNKRQHVIKFPLEGQDASPLGHAGRAFCFHSTVIAYWDSRDHEWHLNFCQGGSKNSETSSSCGGQDACDLLEEKAPMLNEYFMLMLSREQPVAAESGGDETTGEGLDDAAQNNRVNASSSQQRKRRKTNGSIATKGDEDDGGNGSGGLLISSLPLLLEGHAPVPEGLPMFLLRLTTEVMWGGMVGTCFRVFIWVWCLCTPHSLLCTSPRAEYLTMETNFGHSRSNCFSQRNGESQGSTRAPYIFEDNRPQQRKTVICIYVCHTPKTDFS